MWNQLKTAAKVGLGIKDALTALLHPGVFVKDKVYSLIIQVVLFFIKKALSEGIAQKIQENVEKNFDFSVNIPMHAKIKEKLQEDNFNELQELAKEAVNGALEVAGIQCNTLAFTLNEDNIVVFSISVGMKESLKQKIT